MAGEGKSWGGKALSTTFKIAVGAALALAVTPVFADVAIWFPEAHNLENLRIKALQAVAEPYLGWIPRHMGFTEEPGLLTPVVDIFIGPELAKLKREKAQAAAADAARQRDNYAQEPETPEPDFEPPAIEGDPLGPDPLGDGASADDLIADNLLGADPLAGFSPV